jgi:carboxyl-terminal processing protease
MNLDTKIEKPPTRRKPITSGAIAAIIAVVAVVSFVAGTRSHEIEAFVGPLFGRNIAADKLDLSSTEEVYRLLKANFDGELDESKLVDGASAGLVSAAGDPHTSYLTAEEAAEFDRQLKGEFSGIGAEIGVRNDQPTILRVIEGAPAEKAGLKAGDIVVRVDGKSTNKSDASTTADLIRGESGTEVKVTVLRAKETKEFTITRATVTDPSVSSSVKDGIGIIKIRRFDNDTGTLARRAAEQLKDDKVKGIILDMRDNPGGYLDQSQEVAGLWLDHELVVTERKGGKQTESLDSKGIPVLAGVKTVILVNGSSASASEIVAGALKDHKVATLVGETTYGKGTVQQVLSLSNGAQLKVTIAHWYTPGGVNISEKGIAPDTEVKLTLDDLNADRDPQLNAALKMF